MHSTLCYLLIHNWVLSELYDIMITFKLDGQLPSSHKLHHSAPSASPTATPPNRQTPGLPTAATTRQPAPNHGTRYIYQKSRTVHRKADSWP
ncbi:uncharacterized protein TRIREDRAFT_103653 [Trichoderma reesei QM6a]|uniref:Predicted protein n=2 Tax=Hypocrea jecorina TaxID=51453 RepID=G0RB05_HYPJQ|nr:uncharacterized protein TRIREDRAFT_103653 [Trichoderma reesei QM6a]EGR51691.1 predicted protein [Trichoderma reesei QM6a]